MKKLHADISFHITHSNQRDSDIPMIRIYDRLSRHPILEIELNFEDYAKAILADCQAVPCTVELFDDRPIGKKREHKEEIIWVPRSLSEDKQVIRRAVAVLEVDGWKGRDKDATNHYNLVKRNSSPPAGYEKEVGHWVKVTYERWVEPTPEDVKKAAESRY